MVKDDDLLALGQGPQRPVCPASHGLTKSRGHDEGRAVGPGVAEAAVPDGPIGDGGLEQGAQKAFKALDGRGYNFAPLRAAQLLHGGIGAQAS